MLLGTDDTKHVLSTEDDYTFEGSESVLLNVEVYRGLRIVS